MDQILIWLGKEAISHWIFLVLGMGGAALLKILKSRWPFIIGVLRYAIIGLIVSFVFVLLLSQLEKLDKLANERPTRPYFTQIQAEIQNVSQNLRTLTVSVQNNDVPVKDVVTQLLVLEESLDPTIEPLHTQRREEANDIGPRGPLSRHWFVKVGQNARPAFVVFQIRYTDTLSNETYSQDLFLKFLGTFQDGTFIQELSSASSDEKTRIERYIRNRKIPML